ncbi:S8 family peptidase, partial [Vibrio cholerae O1]|nr:S8 family peptidase [Vibrio cholerae O1]
RARSVKLTASITAVAAAAGVTLLATPFAGAAPAPATGTVYGADAATAVSGSYIVMLDQKADKAGLAKEYGGTLQRTY